MKKIASHLPQLQNPVLRATDEESRSIVRDGDGKLRLKTGLKAGWPALGTGVPLSRPLRVHTKA